MTASPLDPLRDLFGERLDALAGGVISGEVPLTSGVVNRLVARQLAKASAPIVSAEVEPYANDMFTVRVRPKGPLPVVHVDVRIEEQPQWPDRPELGLRWALRGLGPLALFAGPVIGYFKALPPWVRLEQDRLRVDLRGLLQSQGLGEVAALVTGVRVLTRDGRFVIQFELRR